MANTVFLRDNKPTCGCSRAVWPVCCWATASYVCTVRRHICMKTWPVSITWMIRPTKRPLGQSAAVWFCGELTAPAGLVSAVTLTPEGDGSPRLVSELRAWDWWEDVWFPEEPALWLSVVVWPKEPAPAQLDLVLKESSFPEEEVPCPKF